MLKAFYPHDIFVFDKISILNLLNEKLYWVAIDMRADLYDIFLKLLSNQHLEITEFYFKKWLKKFAICIHHLSMLAIHFDISQLFSSSFLLSLFIFLPSLSLFRSKRGSGSDLWERRRVCGGNVAVSLTSVFGEGVSNGRVGSSLPPRQMVSRICLSCGRGFVFFSRSDSLSTCSSTFTVPHLRPL